MNKLSNAQAMEEFKELCGPLMHWLNDNFYPHVKVIVDSVTAEMVEGLACIKIEVDENTATSADPDVSQGFCVPTENEPVDPRR
jgi:hypothetical protein